MIRRSRSKLASANMLALLVPLALLAGAFGSQYIGGLNPCEMCWWQRWPHLAAIPVALIAFPAPVPLRRVLVSLAGIAIAISGAIGVFHAGVEYHWWNGITACTSTIHGSGDVQATLDAIMNAPITRCDVAQWTLFGVSLAGYNAILSIGAAIAIWTMAWSRR
ncbi:disulfide bond formation protein B [Sphingomonas sp.]|uniref:disulfide bond formation protein B n=1 Tax=Sphingomonas sp. TaxID=28214 RepID=UPI002C4DA44B|nr:disulfide bond formation protein B [Sphingomonas sp.]HWK35378.1 disulfide bond formation protein B [Sphingomonas sp.]